LIPSINKFFIEVDKSKEALLRDDSGNEIKGLNGQSLFQSLHWSPYEYAEQRGVIYAAPKEVFKLNDSRRKNNYDIKLEKGDIVYIHHFATHNDHSVVVDGIKMYMQDYEQIYAVERNGIIIPLEEYLFIEPDEETEEDIPNFDRNIVRDCCDLNFWKVLDKDNDLIDLLNAEGGEMDKAYDLFKARYNNA